MRSEYFLLNSSRLALTREEELRTNVWQTFFFSADGVIRSGIVSCLRDPDGASTSQQGSWHCCLALTIGKMDGGGPLNDQFMDGTLRRTNNASLFREAFLVISAIAKFTGWPFDVVVNKYASML